MSVEQETKEYQKFSKFYDIKDQVLEKFLRSNTFLPFGLESLKYPTIFTENVPCGAPAATDSKYVFINPLDKFFSETKIDINFLLTFVYLHEVGHNIFSHFNRGEGKDPYLWMHACDYFINLFLYHIEKENKEWDEQHALISMKIDSYKEKILFNQKFTNMIEEEIYLKLQENGQFKKEESEQSYKDFLDNVGIPSNGVSENSKIKVTKTELKIDGKTEKRTFVEFPKSEGSSQDKQSEEILSSDLARTMFETRIISRGFQSQEFEKFLKRIFQVKVPWDVILRDSILIELEKKGDISYSRPRLIWLANPTTLPYLPNIEEEEIYGTLALLIDESGSMNDEDISKAVEIAQQADSYYKNILVIKHDISVRWSKLYEDKLTQSDVDELCIRKHSGGTSHKDAFQKVLNFEKEHNTFISLVLSLSDLCSDISQSQNILPYRIPRIYLKVGDYSVDGIIGKVINIK